MVVLRNTLLTVSILLLVSEQAISLVCFSCENCNDPFDASNIAQVSANGSNIYCKKTKGGKIVDRNITDGCDPFTAVGNGVHCCQTDLCNDAPTMLTINSCAVVLIFGAIAKFVWQG